MSRAELLTARERDVLQLLAHGHTNREIADRLHISVRTAEWHRASIRRKLDLASRAALVAFAGGEEFGTGHGRLSHWRFPERATSVFPGYCAQLSTEADPVVRTEDTGLRRGIIVVMPPVSVAIGA